MSGMMFLRNIEKKGKSYYISSYQVLHKLRIYRKRCGTSLDFLVKLTERKRRSINSRRSSTVEICVLAEGNRS